MNATSLNRLETIRRRCSSPGSTVVSLYISSIDVLLVGRDRVGECSLHENADQSLQHEFHIKIHSLSAASREASSVFKTVS